MNARIEREYFGWCPNCNRKTQHHEIYGLVVKHRRFVTEHCCECGFKHDSKPVDSIVDQHGITIQEINKHIWKWIYNHIDKLIPYNPFPKLHNYVGTIGHPRRHKGEVYPVPNYHPEFLARLSQPNSLVHLRKMLDRLRVEDPIVYHFIWARSQGLSFGQIDELKILPHRLTTYGRKRPGHAGMEKTDYCEQLNRKALSEIIVSLPEDLADLWGSKEMLDELRTPKIREHNKRVPCPKCGGTDKACNVCWSRRHGGDGTVPVWLANKYLERIKSGGVWE